MWHAEKTIMVPMHSSHSIDNQVGSTVDALKSGILQCKLHGKHPLLRKVSTFYRKCTYVVLLSS